ncbi:MAG: Ig domain-containing protein, partial [Planctomycetota bacterium]
MIDPVSGLISGTTTESGLHAVELTLTNGDGISTFLLTMLISPPLEDGADNGSLTWSTGGDAEWFAQADVSSDGVDALQSGEISHGETTWVETTVSGPGTLEFDWRASSEPEYDYVAFSIDGLEQWLLWGEWSNWDRQLFDIPAGNHTLRWTYKKDPRFSEGLDAAWLDQVSFTKTPRITSAATATGETGTAFSFQIVATANPTLFVANGLPSGLAIDPGSGLISGVTTENGVHAIALEVSNSFGTTMFDLSVMIAPPIPEAVDALSLPWSTGGDLPWFSQLSVTSDGVDAARSGAIGDDQMSWLETTIEGPGTLSFDWRVSSEEGFDLLKLLVGGTQQSQISGTGLGWQSASVQIPSGSQTVRWSYEKDVVFGSGDDAAWIDRVAFAAAGLDYNGWRQLYWANANDPNAAPLANPAGDGIVNLLKMAFGLNPLTYDNRPLVPGTGTSGLPVFRVEESPSGPVLVLEYVRRKEGGIVYVAEFTSDFLSWLDAPSNS